MRTRKSLTLILCQPTLSCENSIRPCMQLHRSSKLFGRFKSHQIFRFLSSSVLSRSIQNTTSVVDVSTSLRSNFKSPLLQRSRTLRSQSRRPLQARNNRSANPLYRSPNLIDQPVNSKSGQNSMGLSEQETGVFDIIRMLTCERHTLFDLCITSPRARPIRKPA